MKDYFIGSYMSDFIGLSIDGFLSLWAAGETVFVVCAVLLIVMKKKTVPYIGAIVSLAAALLGYVRYSAAYVYYFGGFGDFIGPPAVIYYIVLALSAAAVTLYWRAHRENRGA